MRALLAVLALWPGGAAAQTLVTSAAPDTVAVTLYREPYRGADIEIDKDDPAGFALITETRRITLPAGRAVVRFEGVAGNIFPETALVAGLPAGVREKNLDADLLSPRSLYDRALGRRVMIRRADKKTGKLVVEQAIIRSAANGAAVIERGGGVEALGYTGLAEAIVYPEIPAGLSAKPTLSIETDSAAPVTATITLTYLAGGFDWQADYLVQLSPDGRSASLNAWATLASSDVTGLPGSAALVAGRVNREQTEATPPEGQALTLSCWPAGSRGRVYKAMMAPPPPPMMAMAEPAAGEIIVTGTRVAERERLADLNLYRVPGQVTVAPKAQKQVGLLAPATLAVRSVYRNRIEGTSVEDPELLLRFTNDKASGLGVPLPAGRVVLFGSGAARPVLLGETSVDDKAVDEKVEIVAGPQPGVTAEIEDISSAQLPLDVERYRLTVTNRTGAAIAYEAEIETSDDQALRNPSARLARRDGRPLWQVSVPAGGSAVLDYSIVDRTLRRRR